MNLKLRLFIYIIAIGLVSLQSYSFKVIDKKIAPPGTIWLKDNLFIDKSEVTNIDWLEYEYWLARFDSSKLTSAEPDNSVWGDYYVLDYKGKKDYLFQYYHRHTFYQDYPVVGISYQQALDYCKWRTDRVNEAFKKKYKSPPVVKFMLPTEEEWEYTAKISYDKITAKYKNMQDKKGNFLVNIKEAHNFKDSNDSELKLPPTWRINIKSKQLQNLIGNVAEMISTDGIAKGGSWKHTLDESHISKQIPYNAPSNWLGFRCIAEVKEQ